MNLFWNQCRRSENQPSTSCGLVHNLWANGPKRRASREDTSHRCPSNGVLSIATIASTAPVLSFVPHPLALVAVRTNVPVSVLRTLFSQFHQA